MDNKALINQIEDAVTIHDYDLATVKIDELNIDAVNLKTKVKNLEICYSKIAIIGGLLQDGFINNLEHDTIKQRIVSHLNQEQANFCSYLNKVAY